jgi:hypothetical protein
VKKVARFVDKLNQMDVEYTLILVMGVIATTAGFNVEIYANTVIHFCAGLLLLLTGILTIAVAVVPLPKLKYAVHVFSIVSMVYGIMRFNSLSAQFILSKTLIISFIVLYALRVIIVAAKE